MWVFKIFDVQILLFFVQVVRINRDFYNFIITIAKGIHQNKRDSTLEENQRV